MKFSTNFFFTVCGFKITAKDPKFDDYKCVVVLKENEDNYHSITTFRRTSMEFEIDDEKDLEKRLNFYKKRVKIHYHLNEKKDNSMVADMIEFI